MITAKFGTSTKESAIKAKTDLIPADIATQLDTNIPAIKTETETTSLNAGDGTVTNLSRMGKLVRWSADLLNNATNGLVNIVSLITAVKTKTDLISTSVAKAPTYETISYAPSLITSNDLITGTKTISATSEASGLGNADYSAALTLPMTCTVNGVSKVIGTTETRLAIIRIGTRSSITIDSDDGTHDLRCRIYVDAQDANHLLQDLTFSTTGNQLNVQDCLVGTKEVIFNLLKDGSAHTFYFFFWSPGNHSPVVSVAQVWEGIGITGTSNYSALLLNINGLVTVGMAIYRVGTSTAYFSVVPYSSYSYGFSVYNLSSSTTTGGTNSVIVKDTMQIGGYGGVTDLSCLTQIVFNIRSDI